ncbi:MAG: asparagine synthase-related protein [Candidatus Sumerlaeota bacterium]|nr:asparagine synthase-related protein [Candidatus Sumerlaeota bacterium]
MPRCPVASVSFLGCGFCFFSACPKRGFSTPLGIWFKRDLKDLTRELIVSDRAVRRGLFRRSILERMLRDHETGRDNHRHRLWSLMCLEMWFGAFVDRDDISGGPI